MLFSLSILTMFLGSLYLLAVEKQDKSWVYILKPGTMVIIILIAILGLGESSSTYGWWILAGLLFSILGDIFLMLPKDRFVYGLGSFLVGHVCYVVGFSYFPGGGAVNLWISGALFLVAILYLLKLSKGVVNSGGIVLFLAVTAYVAIITSMVWAAFYSQQPLIIAGAILFFFSDAILAWDRFIGKLTYRNYLVMIPYYLAQYLFAISLHWV
ncbi:lysoplasmalogenase [Sutcliffiella horikoshii]|uniref:Lysoplasmalogenase n=1 Tax=Sutcliffiella horikoshii TaxID=79883 RepID=A0A5D4SW19_9BACI|nr:lysoplasmalogenase [Sutcliffiella horikoshii]TYS67627.1 lysoplasmalogenase [Sutcliffiella horikoshii]